jgi:ATP-dependent helicase/nuclease subunit A
MIDRFVPLDQEVRNEIRTQLDANICVEAGAGTGKTTVLVDRIVEILRTGHASVEQVAVITFTEKAAAELASRVRRGLEDRLRDPAVGAAEGERLGAAIRGLNHAHIETIHAFAASVLRERPVEAELDPGFEVLDELPAQLAFRAAWDEWITAEMAADEPPAALLDALNLGLDFRYVREAADRLNRHRHALPLRAYEAQHYDAEALLGTLRDAADALRAMSPRMHDPADEAFVAIPDVVDICDGLLALRESDALPRAIAAADLPKYNRGNQTKWFDADDCRATKHQMDRIKKALAEHTGAMRSGATGDLVRWLEGFVGYYAARRRGDGVADFDDLLIWARNLVRDNAEVRRYFQGKYRCMLVDEFQDTDPLQAEMIVRLCAEDGGEADWRRAALRPGSLFVVGDPKQSIYRFRRADITMYDDVKRELFGREWAIVQNFRSAEPIIAWVNRVFRQLIMERTGVQPRYIELEHHPAYEGTDAVTIVRGTVDSKSAAEVRRAEADGLAGLIAREIHAGGWMVRQDGSTEKRVATWRDVVVLIPSRTELHIYEDAFARASIPYRHEGGRTFFMRQEVRELVAVLRAIDDPSDDVATVAALRSSAFGCSDEELLLHRSGGGRFDHESPGRSEVAPVVDALRVLHEFAGMRHDTPLPDLVRQVLDRTRLVEFAMLQPQGDQVAANLLKVIDQARAFADAERSGLRGFTRWQKDSVTRAADRRAGTGGDETDALISEETDDVVRIVTIHASKGLQFPIVVLANMNGERADMTNVISAHDRGEGASVYLKLGAKDQGFRTPGYDDADVLEKEHREAEEKRLLYVAATRAKDRLVVPFFAPEGKKPAPEAKSLNDWLRQAGANTGDAIDAAALPAGAAELPIWRGRTSSAAAGDAARIGGERNAWLGAHDALVDAGTTPLRVLTATSVKDDWEPPWAPDEEVRRGPGRAADFGSAVHALLERVDLRDYADLGERARVVARELGMADRAGEMERVARNALGSGVIDRARASRRVLREVAFTAPLPRDEVAASGFAEGRIDLLFEEEGADGSGLVVVDFKTDDVSGAEVEERAAHYRPQALVYAWAAREATGLLVREVVFLFARGPWEHTMTVDAAFLAEAEALMRAPLGEVRQA